MGARSPVGGRANPAPSIAASSVALSWSTASSSSRVKTASTSAADCAHSIARW